MAGIEGWGYVATSPIFYNGVRAYNAGDSVPDDNVAAHGYLEDGLVVTLEEWQAKQAASGAHTAPETPLSVTEQLGGTPDEGGTPENPPA